MEICFALSLFIIKMGKLILYFYYLQEDKIKNNLKLSIQKYNIIR